MNVCSALNQDTSHTIERTTNEWEMREIVRFLTNQKLFFGRRCNCYFTISLFSNKTKRNWILFCCWDDFFSVKRFFFPFETVGKFYQKKMNFWDVKWEHIECEGLSDLPFPSTFCCRWSSMNRVLIKQLFTRTWRSNGFHWLLLKHFRWTHLTYQDLHHRWRANDENCINW